AALRAQGAAGTTILRAGAAGTVTAVSAGRGAIVAEGAPLLELANSGGLVLVAGAVPADALQIKPGDAARVTPIGADRTLAGTVRMRGAAVDPASGLVPIELTLAAGAALPGESASARITTAMMRGFVVPHEALLVNDAGKTYVVQDVNGAAKFVTVRVLAAAGERDAIDGALDPAAPLILAGAYQLEDGMNVRLSNPGPQAAR
ncbi:MAG: HlyD family efflux transporter periplasmic adaptor subunit, partial [Gammaproteobacteria bacterium]|nr:HlyD family efflux transporter periplasmic adaptor subunit [Gammaproteobacteria bacterium]